METNNEYAILERILSEIIAFYFSKESIESYVGYETRERIGTVNGMQVIIYSNDHNPPHFHVKTNDNRVNAKFKIENGEFLSGEISTKDLKRIELFYNDIKTKILMEKIWSKKNIQK
ncbi:DUF4160 domain-containing protein [Flavobacterium aquicola]|uniref:Uncharacterized protein DUF4160 n=1 Tax=Flavobacterium aquicola TaxID=1682742 RepID=A0A3E0E0G5_9FLAO|nr:DUF4160 domain-containing protein [Flavobacterium aquicola]REG91120.1 uncharacterized protein DUF4160 [Flavobacterium aquicola]